MRPSRRRLTLQQEICQQRPFRDACGTASAFARPAEQSDGVRGRVRVLNAADQRARCCAERAGWRPRAGSRRPRAAEGARERPPRRRTLVQRRERRAAIRERAEKGWEKRPQEATFVPRLPPLMNATSQSGEFSAKSGSGAAPRRLCATCSSTPRPRAAAIKKVSPICATSESSAGVSRSALSSAHRLMRSTSLGSAAHAAASAPLRHFRCSPHFPLSLREPRTNQDRMLHDARASTH